MSNLTVDSTATKSLYHQFESLSRSARQLESFSKTSAALSSANSASTSGSTFSGIISQLQALADSNPTQFKQQSAEIASQMTTAASQSSGMAAQIFKNLASEFGSASQSGSVSAHSADYRQLCPRALAILAKSSASSTAASTVTTPQITQNADGTYGPEHAIDMFTAEVQAAAGGMGVGETFSVAPGTITQVV